MSVQTSKRATERPDAERTRRISDAQGFRARDGECEDRRCTNCIELPRRCVKVLQGLRGTGWFP